jgi:hypothetical protein
VSKLTHTEPSQPPLDEADCPFSIDDLNIILAAEGDQTAGTAVREPFSIKDERTANWLVRKICEYRSYADHVAAWAEAEMRRAHRDEQRLLERFGAQLERWAADQLAACKGRRKFIALPAGTIGFRLQPSSIDVLDENKVLSWCRQNLPCAVRATAEVTGHDAIELGSWIKERCPQAILHERVFRSMLQEHVRTIGVLPDGTAMVGGRDLFYVK